MDLLCVVVALVICVCAGLAWLATVLPFRGVRPPGAPSCPLSRNVTVIKKG